MPWEKTFDIESAIDQTMHVFWEKGFERTSVTDLTEATGVKRQSLYNAIGDKQEIFRKGLLKYDLEHRVATLSALEAKGDPILSIKTLFDGIVQEAIQDTERKGCLLVNTTLELDAHNDEVRLLVETSLQNFETFFVQTIQHGQVRSEIPAAVDPVATAKALLGLFIGMRVLARTSFHESSLHHMADQALRLLSLPS